MKKLILIVVFCVLFISTIYAQISQELLNPEIKNLFHEELSGEIAKEHTIQISRFHRVQGSRGYRASANYVLEQLKKYGFDEKDAYIESFKSDGKVDYQTWQSPSGWDMEQAELRIIEPYHEKIVSFPEIAMSLMTYSNPGNVTAELVWVGKGTSDKDYAGKDVSGKFVLATGYGGNVHRLAVLKYGAKAVVCYLDDDRAKDFPDMLAYTGMWPKTEELDRVTFGFNISKRQGEKLRDLLLADEKVVLHGWAKGIGLEPYFMDIVVAHIRGSEFPDEELVYCAHLDHPKESANDNGSGSAALIDIARGLKKLIESGKLHQPKRSIRFLWVPEFYGTMAYIDKHTEVVGPSLNGKFLANLNLDMVGENLEMIHTKMILTQTPASIPSVLNDVVYNMAAMVDKMNIRTPRGSKSVFNFRMPPYSGGSDHNVFIDRKIPAMMINHSPDYTHHTSEDTPDKVDPVEIERAEMIAAGAFWYLANLESVQAVELVYLSAANSMQRLSHVGQELIKTISSTPKQKLSSLAFDLTNKMDHHLSWEKEKMNSILHFHNSDKVKSHLKIITQQLDQLAKGLQKGISNSLQDLGISNAKSNKNNPDQRVPVRLTRGPLGGGLPESKLTKDAIAWYETKGTVLSGTLRFEILNFTDGNRTISEIRNAVCAEFMPIETEIISHYIEDLITVGVVNWKK